MNKTIEKAARPVSITVICVIGFVGLFFVVPLIFSSTAMQAGEWYPPLLACSAIGGLVCMAGLWRMKKWAVYAYTVFVAVNQVIMLVMGVWGAMSLLISAIVVFFTWKHVAKMS